MIQKIVLIGAGNLATQLGKNLFRAGFEIVQVYSRTEASARLLAGQLNCGFTTQKEEIDLSADLVLLAVKDDAIEQILNGLDCRDKLLVHTAGSVPMQLLSRFSDQFGVFYPVQTFTKTTDVDFTTVPVCIEAANNEILGQLKHMAGKISESVHEISSEQRLVLHLAAVITNNFVNHFYYLGDKLLKENQLSFDLLKPLIKETAEKVMTLSPYDVQTGPAKRYDETIINKHLNLLETKPELRKIYSFVSDSIFNAYKSS